MYSNSSTEKAEKIWRTPESQYKDCHASHASHATHRTVVRYTFIDKDTKCFVTLLCKLFTTEAYLSLSISKYEVDENILPRCAINYYIVNLKN